MKSKITMVSWINIDNLHIKLVNLKQIKVYMMVNKIVLKTKL